MSSAREHRAKAEQLLEEAHATHDQIGRSLILAEAQVHATLALSAPAGKGPPGPGQDEADSTEITDSTLGADSDMPEGSGSFPAEPYGSPGATRRPARPDGPTPTAPPKVVTGKRTPTAKRSVRPPAEPRGDTSLSPPAEDLDRRRRRQRNQRPEQEPGPEGQSPAADDLDEQDPGGPTPS
jgi:hypothetical protein